jgi:hypothetical protein
MVMAGSVASVPGAEKKLAQFVRQASDRLTGSGLAPS